MTDKIYVSREDDMEDPRIQYLNAQLLEMIKKARELREENEKIKVQLGKIKKTLKKRQARLEETLSKLKKRKDRK